MRPYTIGPLLVVCKRIQSQNDCNMHSLKIITCMHNLLDEFVPVIRTTYVSAVAVRPICERIHISWIMNEDEKITQT